VPEGGVSSNPSTATGARPFDGAQGGNVVYELFRAGEAPFEGLLSVIDLRWAMSSDPGCSPPEGTTVEGDGGGGDGQLVDTSKASRSVCRPIPVLARSARAG
jgi:penicillin-binding protein 1A